MERGQAELIAAGARPRRVASTGVEALTPSERRVGGRVDFEREMDALNGAHGFMKTESIASPITE